MGAIIERLNGNRYILHDMNIFTRDFIVSSPDYQTETDKIEGAGGLVDLGTTIGPRDITLALYFDADEEMKYADKRDEVFALFNSIEPFYLIEERKLSQRWFVKMAQPFIPEQIRDYGIFEVELIAYGGLAEAIEKYSETFTTNQFVVFNDGTETIDAREHRLLIKFKGVSDKLRIRNESTGSQWQYLKTTTASDELILDQVYPYKNDKNIFADTDHGAITLATGSNDFRIYGASGDYEISFEFRPLYI